MFYCWIQLIVEALILMLSFLTSRKSYLFYPFPSQTYLHVSELTVEKTQFKSTSIWGKFLKSIVSQVLKSVSVGDMSSNILSILITKFHFLPVQDAMIHKQVNNFKRSAGTGSYWLRDCQILQKLPSLRVTWNQPWWEYIHHGNQQILQISAFSLFPHSTLRELPVRHFPGYHGFFIFFVVVESQ